MGNMCLSLALAILPRGAPARAEMGVLSVESGSWWRGGKVWSQRQQLGCFLLFAPRSAGSHTKTIVANGGFCWGGGGIVGQQRLWQAAQTKGSKGHINGFFGRWQKQNDGKTTPRLEPQPTTVLHIFLSREKHRKELKKIQRGWEIIGVVKLCFRESSPLKRKVVIMILHEWYMTYIIYIIYGTTGLIPHCYSFWVTSSLLFWTKLILQRKLCVHKDVRLKVDEVYSSD